MQNIIARTKRHPTAVSYLKAAAKNKAVAQIIEQKLKRCTSIRGGAIYVLFSELCGGNMAKVAHLCEHCPDELLEKACNSRNKNKRSLINGYFEK